MHEDGIYESLSINSVDEGYLTLAAAILEGICREYAIALAKRDWAHINVMEREIKSSYFQILSMDAVESDDVIQTYRRRYYSTMNAHSYSQKG